MNPELYVTKDFNGRPLKAPWSIVVDEDVFQKAILDNIELWETAAGGVLIGKINGKHTSNPNTGTRSFAEYCTGISRNRRRPSAADNDYRRSAFRETLTPVQTGHKTYTLQAGDQSFTGSKEQIKTVLDAID